MVKKFSEHKEQQSLLSAIKGVAKVTPFLSPNHLSRLLNNDPDAFGEGVVTCDRTTAIAFKDKKSGEDRSTCLMEISIEGNDYKMSFPIKLQEQIDAYLEAGIKKILVSHHMTEDRPMMTAYDITFFGTDGKPAFVKVTSLQPVQEPGSTFDMRGVHFNK